MVTAVLENIYLCWLFCEPLRGLAHIQNAPCMPRFTVLPAAFVLVFFWLRRSKTRALGVPLWPFYQKFMLGHSTELEPGLLARLIYCRLQYLRPLRCHTWVDPFAWCEFPGEQPTFMIILFLIRVFISGKAFVGNWNGHSTHNGTFMMQRQQLRRQRLAIYKPRLRNFVNIDCPREPMQGICML